MGLRIGTVIAAAAMTVGASSAGATTRPILHIGQAKRAIESAVAADRPRSVTIDGCHRLGHRRIRCWVTELGAMNLLSDNGVPVATDAQWCQTITLRRDGHVYVTIF